MNDQNVKDRLIQYLKYKRVSNSEFGRRIGVSNAYVSAIRKSIQPEKIALIAKEFPDLNINWLLTGEGEMLRTVEMPPVHIHTEGDFSPATHSGSITINADPAVLRERIRSLEALLAEKERIIKIYESLNK